jgi:hypothetical protein
MLTRPDPQTIRTSLQSIGGSLSDGIGRGIGRSASDLVEVISGLGDSAPIGRRRPPRPSMLVRAAIVGLLTAAIVGVVAALWMRNERSSTILEEDAELGLDQDALEPATDADPSEMIGIPIIEAASESEPVSGVA